ncbi:MAG: aminotransferase class V-fold PLP-dependent enzyme [Opitutae bacterium]|nr:aminotransferase class V-fold PLP-dependent enzyme [Opitutae bacterium]
MKVPFLNFHQSHGELRAELLRAMEETLDSGQFVLGDQVDRFEKAYGGMMGADSVVGVNSGTSALHLCLRCCGIEAGDEVITTPFTFAASSWGIAYEKAVPVFADIDPNSFNLDPAEVEAAITPKTRAILVVHLFGQPVPMDDFAALARKYDLKLIEDCAQAHMAQYKGRSVGLLGDCGAFSFYPTKNLGGLGEGGLFVSKHEPMTHRARSLRNHAMAEPYTYCEVGYNYRMEGFNGALLRVKLKYLEDWTRRRQAIAERYLREIRLEGLQLPVFRAEAPSVWHQFSVRYPRRERLQKHLQDNGIATGSFYPLALHLQPAYSHLGYDEGDFPQAERVCREVINLPIYPEMSEGQVEYVIETLNCYAS